MPLPSKPSAQPSGTPYTKSCHFQSAMDSSGHLHSLLLHTHTHGIHPGNVYRDASLQLQFTSSLTVSLQRSGFFSVGALISNEFSLFFIEIPKQLWHIPFVLLKTGKWRRVRKIKTQLMIYWGWGVFSLSHSSALITLQQFSLLFKIWRNIYFHKSALTPLLPVPPTLPRRMCP